MQRSLSATEGCGTEYQLDGKQQIKAERPVYRKREEFHETIVEGFFFFNCTKKVRISNGYFCFMKKNLGLTN